MKLTHFQSLVLLYKKFIALQLVWLGLCCVGTGSDGEGIMWRALCRNEVGSGLKPGGKITFLFPI